MGAGRGAVCRWIVAGVALLSALMVSSAALARTMVPVGFEGDVTLVELRKGGGAGTDIWLIRLDSGDELYVDDMAAALLREGTPASKEAWSTRLEVGGVDRRLVPSRELLGPSVWAMAIALWTVWLLAHPAPEPAEEPAPADPRDR